jgi:predicted NBD/HSP70 family sugar kinase
VPGADEESQLSRLIADAPTSRTARRTLDETASYLGAGVANLINLFNPERIVLGGWAGVALGGVLPAIRESAAAQALRQPYQQASIELCQLGVDAVALGAATLPIARLLAAGGVRD